MMKISDIVGSLINHLDAQHELEQCRRRATGDAEYFSYGYVQDFKQAEMDLENTLNAYIDQRVEQRIENLNTTYSFGQLSPSVRAATKTA
jgi:hypothetical protein